MKNFLLILFVLTSVFSCNSNKTENNDAKVSSVNLQTISEKVKYDDPRENLKLSITDTIKFSKAYFFSNPESQDSFRLIINSGLVKSSKSELQIIRADSIVIYSQSFDTFYFIKGIFEPETIPSGSQQDSEAYIDKYIKSLTSKQYDIYFKKNVANFFNDISPIDKERYKEIYDWDEISDVDFQAEINANSNIKLFDIACYDCYEGGEIIGYSQKRNKVITLLEHD